MVRASVQAKSNARLVRRNIENLRKAIPEIGRYRLTEAASKIKRIMSSPGKKVTYPIKWAHKRQMIKVILLLRKAGTLPYVRTQAHERGWKEETSSRGVKVYNSVRGSKYLYGTITNPKAQSSIHVGRWLLLRTVYDSVMKDLPKRVIESLKKIPKVTS